MSTPAVSPSEGLDRFVRAAKAKDVPDDALVALLRQNGWSERRIDRSLSRGGSTTVTRPVCLGP